jgi:hypothetical protein
MLKRVASPHTVGLLAMHHIYDSTKKEHIEARAPQGDLTGRYLYGKPGMVVGEGAPDAVGRYIRFIRSLRWQACVCMGRIARTHEVDPSLPHWEQPVQLDCFIDVPAEHFTLDGGDTVAAHPSERLWSSFDQIASPDALEDELAERGITLAWQLLNRGFRDAHLPPPVVNDAIGATIDANGVAPVGPVSIPTRSGSTNPNDTSAANRRPKARRRRAG